jgi:DNA adenine methylase
MAKQRIINAPLNTDLSQALLFAADEQITERQDTAKPFIKWAGGKRSIINDLLANVPDDFDDYFEPFVGGGALFWNIPRKNNAYISDINFHLIVTYCTIRDNVEEVISKLGYHKEHHDKEYYAKAREKLSDTEDPVEIASLFIYLNKTCYNGLYRVNQSGIFNVPIGRYEDPKIIDADNLRNCSKFLANVDIFQHGFSQIKTKQGDFVYFDPPYHKTFSGYDSSGFGDKEHKELAIFCKELDRQGVLFMLSNSDTPLIRKLYTDFHMRNVDASRFISSKGNERKKENELIICNYIR